MRALLRNGKLPRPRLDVEECCTYVRAHVRAHTYGHGEWAGNGLRVLRILFMHENRYEPDQNTICKWGDRGPAARVCAEWEGFLIPGRDARHTRRPTRCGASRLTKISHKMYITPRERTFLWEWDLGGSLSFARSPNYIIRFIVVLRAKFVSVRNDDSFGDDSSDDSRCRADYISL